MARWLIVVFVLAFAASARAQVESTPGSWPPPARPFADALSYGTLAAEMGAREWHDWRAADRWRAIGCDALRDGIAIAASELLKRWVHEVRPDGSDNLSFPSEHSALAAANAGVSFAVSLPLAFGTTYGRLAANKHHPKDVLAGIAIGVGARFACRGGQ